MFLRSRSDFLIPFHTSALAGSPKLSQTPIMSTERKVPGQTFHAFWASLLPLSNRQTGFSLRSPTRRSSVEFCRVGLCFHYRLEYDTPNALVECALLRNDGEQIYHSLVRRRKQINDAFGGSLLWG